LRNFVEGPGVQGQVDRTKISLETSRFIVSSYQ